MSGDLHAAVEGLPEVIASPVGSSLRGVMLWKGDVQRLIPEGAVLVTEETLAAALHEQLCAFDHDIDIRQCEDTAAAILRHLREGT